MAVLDATNRERIARVFMRLTSGPLPCIKGDVRAAVNAADDWVDANSSAFNLALPVAFRNAANATQKTLLLCYVAMRRAGILKAEED